jgi:hypothetical protein
VEAVRRAPSVGEQEEPDASLRDEQRLREDERVRDERSGSALAPVGDEPNEGRPGADDDHRDPERDVQADHRAHPR